MSSEIWHRKSCLHLLSFMKFPDWNVNKIDINLFITYFVIRFYIYIYIYMSGSSQTDDPGKYKKSLVS